MRWLVTMTIAAVTACSLTTDFSGLSSGSVGSPDGSSSSSSSSGGPGLDGSTVGTFDAGSDAAKGEVLPTGGVVIAANASTYAAGSPQQHHVHFAYNLGAYVVFYLSASDRNSLHTRITPDFVTFVDGPSLPLPHPHDNEGRNFDVAYANIGGSDVFHLAISIHDGPRYSLRARGRAKSNGSFTFDAVTELDHDSSTYPDLDPDGPSVAILSSRRVIISNGYNGVQGHTGNAVVWVAQSLEDGAESWDHAFAPGVELETASKTVNARSLIEFSGGAALTWERGDEEPNPTNLGYSLYDGVKWSTVGKIDFSLNAFDVADWNQVATSDGRGHILRFSKGAYEYIYYDGLAHLLPPPAAIDHSVGDGIALLAQANVPSAFVLTRNDHALKRSTRDGSTWSAWTEVLAADPSRTRLSGNGDALLWQRGSDLAGLRLAR